MDNAQHPRNTRRRDRVHRRDRGDAGAVWFPHALSRERPWKYSWRHRQKNGAEDLAKADVYRAWMLAARRRTAKHPPILLLLAEGIALADGFR